LNVREQIFVLDDIKETIESSGCQYLIKWKEHPTLTSQVTAPSISFIKGEEGRETTALVTKLDTWEKDRRYVVSRFLKPEKDRVQLSFLEGSDFETIHFVTNTELPSEKVVIAYEKRGNAENYIKDAKYDMAESHFLLQSCWANEAIFQLIMLTHNLFLLFKLDFANGTEYRQQIKTFRLKYIFLAGKITRMAKSEGLKLSTNYPNQEI